MGRQKKYNSEEEKKRLKENGLWNTTIEIEQFFKRKLENVIVEKDKWN